MSDQATTAKADPAPYDPDEVDKFKARFGAARGKEIDDANTEAVQKTQAVAALRGTVTRQKEEAATARKLWTDKKGLRERKPKPGSETSPEALLRQGSEAADANLATSRQELTTTEQELAAAVKKLEKSPREAYNEKFKQLNRRLNDCTKGEGKKGQTLPGIDSTVAADVVRLLDRRDYHGVDGRLVAVEDKVLAIIAPKEMAGVHARLAARLKTLTTQGLSDANEVKALASQLDSLDPTVPTGAALGQLEREAEPALKAMEDRVQAFLDLVNVVEPEVAGLGRKGVAAAAAHHAELSKCRNIAKGKLEDAQTRLETLQKDVAATALAVREAAAAAAQYPIERAAVLQRIAEFPGISASHKAYNGAISGTGQVQVKLRQAQTAATGNDFTLALIYVRDADELLDDLDERATDKENATATALAKQQLLAAAQAAALAQQQAIALAQQQAVAALQAQINAMDTNSLDVIGKAADFEVWMDKVNTLWTQQPAVVAVAVGTPYWLNGNNTVEIEVGVTGAGFADFFVVHFHPYPYVNPHTGHAEPPKMHAKPYCGNATTPHDYRVTGSSHWLFGLGLPQLGAVLGLVP